jgi:hypothetical protein
MQWGKLSLTGLGSLPFFCLPAAYAADSAHTGYVLEVQPSICVSYDSEEPCTMAMQVSWQGTGAPEVCPRELLTDPLLQCWQNTTTGSIELMFVNAADVRYQLQDTASGDPLAVADVKVINRDLRNSRKRRRHVWSIL